MRETLLKFLGEIIESLSRVSPKYVEDADPNAVIYRYRSDGGASYAVGENPLVRRRKGQYRRGR